MQPSQTQRHAWRKREQGGTLVSSLMLLLLIAGLAGYNYHRNWKAEGTADNRPRPFAGYDEPQLHQLRDAYSAQIRASEQGYAAQEQRRQRASGGGLMNERVDEFEKIQRNSTALRARAGDVAVSESRLKEIEAELAIRRDVLSGLDIHLQRLTRI